MGEGQEVGFRAIMTKQLSEADVALFELVTRDDTPALDEPPAPVRKPRQAAPFALLSAFLASAVARVTHQPGYPRFRHQSIHFSAPAYTDDILTAVAELREHDTASRDLRIYAWCDNQEGMRLAEGDFTLVDERG